MKNGLRNLEENVNRTRHTSNKLSQTSFQLANAGPDLITAV